MPGRSGGGMSSRPMGDRGFSSGPPVDSAPRDWGEARGSKFQASAPASPSLGGGGSGRFGDRSTSGGGAPPPRMGGFRDADGQGAAPQEDRDWGAARGGRFAPSAPAPERRSAAPERQASESDGARDWRARAAPVASRTF